MLLTLATTQAASWSLGMCWRRSLPRYIGLELLIYIVLYYTLQLVYRLSTIGKSEVLILMIFLIRLPSLIIKNVRGLLDEDQRQQFADIVTYFKENLTPLARDLAFLLGFYVKVLTDAKQFFCHRSGCCGEMVGAVQNITLA